MKNNKQKLQKKKNNLKINVLRSMKRRNLLRFYIQELQT